MGIFSNLFKSDNDKFLAKLDITANKIELLAEDFQKKSDEELSEVTVKLKNRLKNGETLDDILPEAFAAVREASTRVLKMRHYHVQLLGGIALYQGRIAEMSTGEGKTLVATLPAYLMALEEKGVHIVTVNDYLAKRDAEWMGKIYKFLGLSVGVILPNMNRESKREAYNADITYCTNNELGFDYLRDNMAIRLGDRVQRGLNFAIVDEVDSILIDEARTPLIISGKAGEASDIYVQVNRFVKTLHEDDFTIDEKESYVLLTEQGVDKAEKYFKLDNFGDVENAELLTKINTALRAHKLMQKDKEYIVSDGEIVIVDEFTGRQMIGRRYNEGLHQAIEAKENVAIKDENRTIATITFQNLFRLYKKLSGMTGTAKTEEPEFRGIYNLDVIVIPTNRANIRRDEADRIYIEHKAKIKAILEEIQSVHKTGQPLLVGTVSVEASEEISKELIALGIKHNVLNAKNHKEEASIIAQAGAFSAVTIATNMAGRGTDILLGGNPEFMAKQQLLDEGVDAETVEGASAFFNTDDEEILKMRARFRELLDKFTIDTEAEKAKVIEVGGLRVIGTERHESRRIDNQLRGRCARQGDPGSSCFIIAFDDELLRIFGGDRIRSMLSIFSSGDEDIVLQTPMLSKQIENAQKRCEENNFARRKYVLNYDDVMNQQRKLIYEERNKVLEGVDVHEQILKYLSPVIEGIVEHYVSGDIDYRDIDYKSFNLALEQRVLDNGINLIDEELCGHLDKELIVNTAFERAVKDYNEKIEEAKRVGVDFADVEREVLLRYVDKHWMAHIAAMDDLRKGIGLRGLGQRDPVMEYRREGSNMFDEMIESVQRSTVTSLMKIQVETKEEREERIKRLKEQRGKIGQAVSKKVAGRNDPCPCGSGLKYKNCCGK